jgi:hypothetical protein
MLRMLSRKFVIYSSHQMFRFETVDSLSINALPPLPFNYGVQCDWLVLLVHVPPLSSTVDYNVNQTGINRNYKIMCVNSW